jgi:hypothetical protein
VARSLDWPYFVFLLIVESAAGSGDNGRGVAVLLFVYRRENIQLASRKYVSER